MSSATSLTSMTSCWRSAGKQLLARIEAATPKYSGRGETALAAAVIPLTFIYKILDSLHGQNAIPGEPWAYILLLSLFTAVGFSSVLWLATPIGERWIRKALATKTAGGSDWQRVLLVCLPSLYVGLFLILVGLLARSELSSQALPRLIEMGTDLSPAAGGLGTVLLLLAAAVVSIGCFWLGLSLTKPKMQNPSATPSPEDSVKSAASTPVFGLRQLGGVLLAALPFLLLQDYLPVLWCFTTPVAVTVMVYGSGLGREYFNFSFVPRSVKEAGFVLLLMGSGLLLFLLVTLGAGTISYTGGLWRAAWPTVVDSIFTWLLIVGISEEIIFRCGVLTLITGVLFQRPLIGWWGRYPRLAAVLLTSVLFALAHLFRGATMIFLAFLASLLYGLAFVAGKSLFGPVLLHGLLNVLILMNFHLADFQ